MWGKKGIKMNNTCAYQAYGCPISGFINICKSTK